MLLAYGSVGALVASRHTRDHLQKLMAKWNNCIRKRHLPIGGIGWLESCRLVCRNERACACAAFRVMAGVFELAHIEDDDAFECHGTSVA